MIKNKKDKKKIGIIAIIAIVSILLFSTTPFFATLYGGFNADSVGGYAEFSQSSISGNKTILFTESNVSLVKINVTNNGNIISTASKYVPITVTSSIDLTGQQLNFTVNYDSDMQPDFADVRFEYQNGTNIPYFIDSYIVSSSADFIIKGDFPTGDTIINCLYGGGNTVSASSGIDVFELYDDFKSLENEWNRYVNNPILTPSSTNSDWDSGFVNDPAIAKHLDGTPYQDVQGHYYMYYTGSAVSGTYAYNEDQIGLARSTDLYNWEKYNEGGEKGLIFPIAGNSNWDGRDVQLGTVLVDDSGTFWMFFNGNSNSATDDTTIGVAQSTDGITWTDRTEIIDEGKGDATVVDIYSPMVFYDSTEATNKWKMYYIHKNTGMSPQIGIKYAFASSPDGTWTIGNSGNRVISYPQNVWQGEAWYEDSEYHMIFEDYSDNSFHYATSNDGESFTEQGQIFTKGEAGQWDDTCMHFVSSIQVGDTWYHYYRGDEISSTPLKCKIGLATSATHVPTILESTIDSTIWDTVTTGTSTLTISGGKLDAMSGSSAADKGYIMSKTLFGSDYILEGYGTVTASGNNYGEFGFGSTYLNVDNDLLSFLDGTTTNGNWYLYYKNAGTAASTQVTGDDSYHTFKIIREDAQARYYVDDTLKYTLTNTAYIPSVDLSVDFGARNGQGSGHEYLDWVRVRKYTSSIPTTSFGTEQSISSNPEFTVSVTGDSDIHSYLNSELREISLIPTSDISQIDIISNSNNYNYNAKIYYSQTATELEEINNVTAFKSVQFTPNLAIKDGYVNVKFEDINFSNYTVDSIYATLDDVEISNVLRDNNTISLQIENVDTTLHTANCTVSYSTEEETPTIPSSSGGGGSVAPSAVENEEETIEENTEIINPANLEKSDVTDLIGTDKNTYLIGIIFVILLVLSYAVYRNRK